MVEENKKINWIESYDLLGLVLKTHHSVPGVEIEADETINVNKEVVSYDRGVCKAHNEGMHALVERALHKKQGLAAQEIGDGAGVTALEQLPLVLQHKSVCLWIRREHCWLTKHMGREQAPVFTHPRVNERLRVLRLVC